MWHVDGNPMWEKIVTPSRRYSTVISSSVLNQTFTCVFQLSYMSRKVRNHRISCLSFQFFCGLRINGAAQVLTATNDRWGKGCFMKHGGFHTTHGPRTFFCHEILWFFFFHLPLDIFLQRTMTFHLLHFDMDISPLNLIVQMKILMSPSRRGFSCFPDLSGKTHNLVPPQVRMAEILFDWICSYFFPHSFSFL